MPPERAEHRVRVVELPAQPTNGPPVLPGVVVRRGELADLLPGRRRFGRTRELLQEGLVVEQRDRLGRHRHAVQLAVAADDPRERVAHPRGDLVRVLAQRRSHPGIDRVRQVGEVREVDVGAGARLTVERHLRDSIHLRHRRHLDADAGMRGGEGLDQRFAVLGVFDPDLQRHLSARDLRLDLIRTRLGIPGQRRLLDRGRARASRAHRDGEDDRRPHRCAGDGCCVSDGHANSLVAVTVTGPSQLARSI